MGWIFILKFVHLDILVHTEDLGLSELFPGLNVHVSFGRFGQPDSVLQHKSDNCVLVDAFPSFCLIIHECNEEVFWCWFRWSRA